MLWFSGFSIADVGKGASSASNFQWFSARIFVCTKCLPVSIQDLEFDLELRGDVLRGVLFLA